MVQTRLQQERLLDEEAEELSYTFSAYSDYEDESDTLSQSSNAPIDSRSLSIPLSKYVLMYRAVVLGDESLAQSIIEKYPDILSQHIHPETFTEIRDLFESTGPIPQPGRHHYNQMMLSESFFDVVFSLPLLWACEVADYNMAVLLVKKCPQSCSFKVFCPYMSNRIFDLPLHITLNSHHDWDHPAFSQDDIFFQQEDIVLLLIGQYPRATSIKGRAKVLPIETAFDMDFCIAVGDFLYFNYDENFVVNKLRFVLEDQYVNPFMALSLYYHIKLHNFEALFKRLNPRDGGRSSDRLWERRDGTLFSLFYDKVIMSGDPIEDYSMDDTPTEWRDYPLFENAMGTIPLDIIQSIADKDPESIALYCDPLLVVVKKASEYPEDWERYYKHIFQLIFKATLEKYQSNCDQGGSSELSEFLSLKFGENKDYRHLLHEAADLALPSDALQMIASNDPRMLNIADKITGLLPFMLGASGRQSSLTTVYELFRRKPDCLSVFLYERMCRPSAFLPSSEAFVSDNKHDDILSGLKRKRVE